MDATLLHLVTPSIWREALAVGAVRPSVAEFVHLSAAAQVAIPANRLHAGALVAEALAVAGATHGAVRG